MSGRYRIDKTIPIAMKWPIPELALYKISNTFGHCLQSDSFKTNIDGVRYYFEIFPNGDTEEHLEETWIFLNLENSRKYKIEADFKISIPTANFNFKGKHVFEKLGGYGIKICATDEFFDKESRYRFLEKIVVVLDGNLNSSTYVDNEGMTTLLFEKHGNSVFNNLWSQDTKDFTIVAEGKEIKVHKCILAAQSPVFTKMFESGMKEAQENKVEIPDFSFKIVKVVMKFCYQIDKRYNKLFMDDKMKILQFLDKYEIQPLKENMEIYLISEINNENVCLLANCSLLSNALNLEEKCFEFLSNCAANKTPVNDFDLLDKDFALKFLFYPLSK